VVLAGTATATTPAQADFTPISAQAAAGLLRRATVQVLAFGCDLQRHEGTAVAVGSGRFLTNQHVVAGSRLVDLVADGAPTQVGDQATVALAGDVADLPAPGLDTPTLALAPRDPLPGTAVHVAGFPSAPSGQREPGLVIDSQSVVGYTPGPEVGQPWPVLRLSGTARPGMSGGPVLDASGRLAGILFGIEVPTGQALAIPASALRRLLRSSSFVATSC
jgi:S1-C subfamily serine protease